MDIGLVLDGAGPKGPVIFARGSRAVAASADRVIAPARRGFRHVFAKWTRQPLLPRGGNVLRGALCHNAYAAGEGIAAPTLELANDGIRVKATCPGVADTLMVENILTKGATGRGDRVLFRLQKIGLRSGIRLRPGGGTHHRYHALRRLMV
jgi:hypothetical protein